MIPRPLSPLVLALLAFLLVAVPQARAEPIQWSYQGQVVTTGPSADLGPKVLVSAQKDPKGPPILTINTSQRVEFADVSGSGTGLASVPAFQMQIHTSPGGGQGTFSKDIHTFDLGFRISDGASGASGLASFHGTLDGFTGGFGPPTPVRNAGGEIKVGFTGLTEQTLKLGDHLYKVGIDPFTFLYSQVLTNRDDLTSPYQGVPIRVQASPVSEAPEPSTLALAAMGLAGLGLRAWRKRRAARA